MKNVHVLQTDKPSRLIHNDANQLCYQSNKSFKNDRKLRKKFNIYITSSEEIKEGDWILNEKFKDIYKITSKIECNVFNTDKYLHIKKIILTTDQDLIKDGVQGIDDEFLEWFVKNPSCEEVEIAELWKQGYPSAHNSYQIFIPKEEPKQETLADKLKKLLDNMSQEEFNEEWKKVTDLKLEGPSIIQHVELINKNIDEFDSKVKEFKEKQKQHLIEMMKADEELGLYEEPKQETLEHTSKFIVFTLQDSEDWVQHSIPLDSFEKADNFCQQFRDKKMSYLICQTLKQGYNGK